VERARRIGEVMLPRLRALQSAHPVIGDVRGRGAMVAIELVGADEAPDAALASAISSACHAEGVLVLTAGTYGNVLRFLPPLVIPDDVLDDGLGVLEKVFAAHTG
jgi:4-aminobutyrate aminotransferase/(S)-3-amino-2-methylpropionate transaminase